MLINPKRNIFRVAATGDSDIASIVSSPTLAALGFTLATGAAGLVPYGPAENAGPVTRSIAEPGATPDVAAITYTRLAGPIDVPLALALAYVRHGLADLDVMEAAPGTGFKEVDTIWKAGTISGEVDVPVQNVDMMSDSGVLSPATGTTALVAQSWVHDAG